MNVRSMTGYGKIDGLITDCPLSTEIRSVNNRYLEISLKVSKELLPYEGQLKKTISQYLTRGSVNLSIQVGANHSGSGQVTWNKEIVAQYLNSGAEICEAHDLKNDLTIKELIQLPDVFGQQAKEPLTKETFELIKTQLIETLKKVVEMREAEGENLNADLRERIAIIDTEIKTIEVGLSQRLGEYKNRLHEKVSALSDEHKLDEARFAQEVAYMVDKMDITEEIVRFHSHNQLFIQTLESKGPHGKKLNFLLQEMGREANTLSTKSHFVEFQHRAIRIKEEIEAMREQVQNIE